MKKIYKTPEIKIEELERADVMLDSDTSDQDNGKTRNQDLISFALGDLGLV